MLCPRSPGREASGRGGVRFWGPPAPHPVTFRTSGYLASSQSDIDVDQVNEDMSIKNSLWNLWGSRDSTWKAPRSLKGCGPNITLACKRAAGTWSWMATRISTYLLVLSCWLQNPVSYFMESSKGHHGTWLWVRSCVTSSGPSLSLPQSYLWGSEECPRHPDSGTHACSSTSLSTLMVTHSLVLPRERELRDSEWQEGDLCFGKDKTPQLASSYQWRLNPVTIEIS